MQQSDTLKRQNLLCTLTLQNNNKLPIQRHFGRKCHVIKCGLLQAKCQFQCTHITAILLLNDT